jgi:hypothetical protein
MNARAASVKTATDGGPDVRSQPQRVKAGARAAAQALSVWLPSGWVPEPGGRLKPDQRMALLLAAAGYSYREIGQRRGWTYTKVNRCVNEGRAALRASAPPVWLPTPSPRHTH